MTRSRKVQLEQDIVTAAREWVAAGENYVNRYLEEVTLKLAVAALDIHLLGIEGTVGAYGQNSPDTSVAAAHLAISRQGSVRHRIIAELYADHHTLERYAGPQGITDDAIERRLRIAHSTASSARNWLVNAGWLHDSGFRRKTAAGRNAIVWALTPAALAHLRSL